MGFYPYRCPVDTCKHNGDNFYRPCRITPAIISAESFDADGFPIFRCESFKRKLPNKPIMEVEIANETDEETKP